jgi:5'-methylthioadenosine phosphorylase
MLGIIQFMLAEAALIAGTGIADAFAKVPGQPLCVLTEFGPLRGRLITRSGLKLLLLQRHSAGHKVPPHSVNYRAAAAGLKQLGIKWCISSAAVGSLREDWGAGTLVACSDFWDVSGRNLSLFDRTVIHTDFSEPFSGRIGEALRESGLRLGIPVQPKGIYINGNGPRYETPHEIQLMRSMGDVIGMTAASEAIVMREAGVGYGCLAVVSNLASGIGEGQLNHEDVVRAMHQSGERALAVMLAAAQVVIGGQA